MSDYSYVVVVENPLGHRSAFTIIVKADNSARADEIVDRAKGALREVVDHANSVWHVNKNGSSFGRMSPARPG